MDRVEPGYTISYIQKQDGSYVWSPPEGSPELEEALNHQFPRIKGLKMKMLAARTQVIESKAVVAREARKESARLHSFHTSVLDAKTMDEANEKSQKSPWHTCEKSEVYRNRNMTCAYHKKRKEKCHPGICRDNKLYKAPQPDYMAMVTENSVTSGYLGGKKATDTSEDDRDDRNGDGNDGQNGRRGHNSDEYGDYWKTIDEDSNGTSGPFGGGTAPNGGGYPKAGGGYYSLGDKHSSSSKDRSYTFSPVKATTKVQNGATSHAGYFSRSPRERRHD